MDFLYEQSTREHDWIYDIETYPNIFTLAIVNVVSSEQHLFEISSRKNDVVEMINFINNSQQSRWVGFNNIAFDYPVIHFILSIGITVTVREIYEKAMSIIATPFDQRFNNIIREPVVKQLDLLKIHHFDNPSRMTSLKTLEINMMMSNVEDLPYAVGSVLDDNQMDELITYNWHDVRATTWFYQESNPMIDLREELSIKYDRDFTNHNDAKIGSDIFVIELEKNNIECYEKTGNRRTIRQTKRTQIILSDCIFPYIKLEHPEFNRIHHYLKNQIIIETKGVFKDLTAHVEGNEYVFGTGGLHQAVDPCTVKSNDEFIIIDADVTSMYPNLAIRNRVYPEHLSEKFCDIYENIFNERQKYKKGTPENAAFKLALNATYGNSNNKYSPMYDPKFTMSITLSGQLSLCMLIELFLKIPGVKILSTNTDGVCSLVPRYYEKYYYELCDHWCELTKLKLEYQEYETMHVMDVNNFIGVTPTGKLKRKGKYCYGSDLGWHQNHSSQIVAKAAQAALVNGEDIGEFIREHSDPRDFLMMSKVPRNSKLALSTPEGDVFVPNIVRYVVTTDGCPLNKVMPPAGPEGEWKRKSGITDAAFHSVYDNNGGMYDGRIHTANRSKYETRRIGICTGWLVTICNDIQQLNNVNINYDYYIAQAEKLVKPLRDNLWVNQSTP